MTGHLAAFNESIHRWFAGSKSDLKNVHLDHILNGTTCQPISLNDFRFYLLNKEHTSENLDFYFWYIDYRRRFFNLPAEEQAKSKPPKEKATPNSYSLPLDDLKKEKVDEVYTSPFGVSAVPSELGYKTEKNQPFREEVDSVLRTFFHVDSYKELNIEGYMSKYAIYYGCQTTHPDVFADVHEHVYNIMKTSSLKNFVHYALQNMRHSWVIIHYVGGIFNFLHIPMILFYTFSHHTPRWYRLALLPFTFLFAMSILSGRAGFCTIRASMKIRMVPMYELDQYHMAQGKIETPKKYSKDIESQQDLTHVIDPNVLKHSRQMVFHIWSVSLILALIVTSVGLAITNENDPMPPA